MRAAGEPHESDRFELVFLLLIVSFLLSAFLTVGWTRYITLGVYVMTLLLALRNSGMRRRTTRRYRWVAISISVLLVAVALITQKRPAEGLLALWLAAVVGLTIVVVVRRVLNHRVVTLQTIFGALSAYLLLGFMFAASFGALASFSTSPFFAGGQPAKSNSLQYFSFVTLTTTGYGDYTAANDGGRTLAVMEALFGQIFLVSLVARLVSVFGQVRAEAPSGTKRKFLPAGMTPSEDREADSPATEASAGGASPDSAAGAEGGAETGPPPDGIADGSADRPN